jgi:hypothetical protein
VVLSDRLWRRRFAADPAIVDTTIRLDDENYVVTGVMPASFDFPLATELWTPQAHARTAHIAPQQCVHSRGAPETRPHRGTGVGGSGEHRSAPGKAVSRYNKGGA